MHVRYIITITECPPYLIEDFRPLLSIIHSRIHIAQVHAFATTNLVSREIHGLPIRAEHQAALVTSSVNNSVVRAFFRLPFLEIEHLSATVPGIPHLLAIAEIIPSLERKLYGSLHESFRVNLHIGCLRPFVILLHFIFSLSALLALCLIVRSRRLAVGLKQWGWSVFGQHNHVHGSHVCIGIVPLYLAVYWMQIIICGVEQILSIR